MRQEGLRAVHHAPEVDVHDAVDVLELHVLDLAVVGDSGIVEDRVDPAEMIGDGLRVLEHRFAFGDVEQLAVHLRAGRLDEPLGLGETVGVDVADGDLGAALAELDGQFPAHARRGTGDDDDLVAEVLHG